MRTNFSIVRSLVLVASLTSNVHCGSVDYLIVGGGTAGLVLANRLTENPKVNVLVLEAGGDGLGNINISSLSLIGAATGTQLDWKFKSEPLVFANDRILSDVPRGKVLGGSSAINGDVFNRGDAREYDMWEALGNPGWNSKSILAAGFKAEHFFPPNASENIQFVLSDHGLSGPLATSYVNPAPPFHEIIISSLLKNGGHETPDNGGGHVDGMAHVTNARLPSNNTRATSATGYYFPFSFRPNLQVILFATVDKIVWKSTTPGNVVAAGVSYIDENGASHTVNGTTVILAGGTYGSPPILERSGVGNTTIISSLGINPVVDLPGVGENLQEQTLATMQFQLNTTFTLPTPQPLFLNMESLQTTVGPNYTATIQSLIKVKPDNLSPALFNASLGLYKEQDPWVEGFTRVSNPTASGPTVLSWILVNLRPHSRGSIHIVSTDPNVLPTLQLGIFESPFDTFVMASAARRALGIISTPPLSDWIVAPLSPPANVTTIPQLEDFVRSIINIPNHPLGTALMSPQKDGGVVDPTLKVYGTQNVYVVDASIIPVQPAAHLQATVYALAERAAELFIQRS